MDNHAIQRSSFFSRTVVSVAAALFAAVAVTAPAASFKSGGLTYTTISEPSGDAHGTCKVGSQRGTIEGVVEIPDYVSDSSGKIYDVVEIQSNAFSYYYNEDLELTEVKIGDNVKTIGSSAFEGQYYLSKVTFGENVESIGGAAFSECVLAEVTLPSKLKTLNSNVFNENSSLRIVTLNDGLESIGNYAFYKCYNLPQITIPASVTSIAFDRSAFGDCRHMTSMDVAEGNTVYSSMSGIVYNAAGSELLFCPAELSVETLVFPDALASIGSNAFKGNTTIKAIEFPQSLVSIGNDAFKGCTSLTALEFPGALRTIGEHAFDGCTGLESVSLNEGLEELQHSVFKNCTSLTEVAIPASLVSAQWSTFNDCSSLTGFTVAPGNTHFRTHGGALILDDKIITYAVANPARSFAVPDDVNAIASYAFEKAGNLEVVNTGRYVTSIGDLTFLQMPLLRDVTLGPSLRSMEQSFAICDALAIVRCESAVIPTWGMREAFGENTMANATLYVPDVALADYKQSLTWGNFADIRPLSQAPAIEMPEEPRPGAAVAHAYQMGSTDQKWGFVQFQVNDLSGLTVDKATTSYDDQIGAGEYVDGKYYTFTLEYDFIMGDGLEPSEYVVWDVADNFRKESSAAATTGRVVDMAFDYINNTMYALKEINRTDNGAIGLTALNVVDMASGEMTLVGLPGEIKAVNGNGETVDEHLVGLASDPSDGQLYAMGEYRQLYKLDRLTGTATPVGGRNRIAITNDFQSMAFSAEGKLYQAQMHPDYEYFMEIDTQTGALTNPVTGETVVVDSDFTNNAARFPYDPQLTGLYFEGKELDKSSAKAATGLTAVVRDGTSNTVDLSWTNPVETYDGGEAQLTAVKVYRFGSAEVLAVLSASATSYTDEAAPDGDVTYLVVAETAGHAGFPAWATVFSGADRLKAVTNLTVELEGNEAVLTWTAPTETVNGGYSDYENITYVVSRTKGTETVVVDEGLASTNLSVRLTENGTYTFTVVPVSCGVEGVPATTEPVTLQGVEQLPYETGFEDNDGGTLWTVVNNQGGSYGWSVVTGYAYQQLSGKFAQFKTGGSSTFPADDWFISPAIHMPAGQCLLKYFANGGSYDTHSYKVWLGENSTSPEDFQTLVFSLENEKVYTEDTADKNYVEMTHAFNVPSEGDYRIAFQGIGASTYATLKIDNLSVVYHQSSGLEVVGLEDGINWNPATCVATCAGASSIELYDMQGRMLASVSGDSLHIAVKGIVFVKAITPDGVKISKIAAR